MENIIKTTTEDNLIKLELNSIIHPFYLRVNTSDIPTFHQIFRFDEYDINLGITPKNIIDCGANIGLASLYFKNIFPESRIISIEPEKSNYELLKRNTRNYSDIFCLKNGIWNQTTNLELIDSGKGNWGFMVKEVNHSCTKNINGLSIDYIMKMFDIEEIDLLKIDIEGSEKELFEKNYDYWLPRTKIIIIEFHDHFKKGCAKSFFKALTKFEFRLEYKGENLVCFLG